LTTEFDQVGLITAFGDSWKRVQRSWERNLASSVGLTITELRILKSLSISGPSPMVKFANALYMTPASITGLVDRLEAEKLVERERGSEDRRVVNVKLTSKGEDKLAVGLKLYNNFMKKALSALSEDETNELLRLLAKVAEIASKE
jgi:DNA-binding MarR family transcriptional regulator